MNCDKSFKYEKSLFRFQIFNTQYYRKLYLSIVNFLLVKL